MSELIDSISSGGAAASRYSNAAHMEQYVSSSSKVKTGDDDYSYLAYPEDLLADKDNKYNNERVVFFINVNNDSTFANQNNEYNATAGLSDSGTSVSAKLIDLENAKYNRRDTKSRAAPITSSSVGSVIGKVSSAVVKRLSVAIALHMPNQLTNNTSVDWQTSQDSSGILDAISAAITESKKENGSITGAMAGRVLAGALSGDGADKWQRATRVTPGNTKQEMQFEGVGFREFDFNYSFSPKSSSEAKTIMNIIRTFKFHMLPEYKGAGEFLFSYPSEFQIMFFRGTEENTFVDKYLTSVLTAVNVDYTGDSQWSTFNDGMPTRINLGLRFKELGIVTKNNASRHGYHGA